MLSKANRPRGRAKAAGETSRGAAVVSDSESSTIAHLNQLASAADLARLLPSIKWHWCGWLPRGFVTCIVGEPGVGKSQITLAIVKSLITGAAWPDGTAGPGKSGKIIWCDTEASQALLSERIQNWKLPGERVLMPGDDPLTTINLSEEKNHKVLREMVMNIRPIALVVDSLVGSHSGEENSSKDMRRVMSFLAGLARDANILIIVIHHLRKRGLNDGEEINIDRVRGSGAITSYARIVIGISAEKDDGLRLSVVKSNLARKPDPLGATLSDSGVTFGDAPKATREQKPNERADSFLQLQLANGPRSFSKLEEAAKVEEISKNRLYESRKRLGVVVIKRKWTLPADNPFSPFSKNGNKGNKENRNDRKAGK